MRRGAPTSNNARGPALFCARWGDGLQHSAADIEDDDDVVLAQRLGGNRRRKDDRMHLVLAHTAGDAPEELGAEIEDGDCGVVYGENANRTEIRANAVNGGPCPSPDSHGPG